MKHLRKNHVFLLVVTFILLFSLTASAAERKGFFSGWWERVKSRLWFKKEAQPVQEEEKIKVPAEAVKPVSVEKVAAEKEEEVKAEEEPEEASPKPKRPARKKGEKPSKSEMIDTMKRRLQVFKEIVDIIPNLVARKKEGEEALEYYYVSSDGIPLELTELDKDTLYRLYVKVNQEATRMHTERLLRQIRQQEQLMRLQNLQRIQQGPPRPPAEPPKTPKVYTPPKGPPKGPPALPPKVPSTRKY